MNDSTQKPRRGESRGENHEGSRSVPTLAQDEDTQPPTSTDDGVIKVRTWDVITGHPIAQKLDTETQLALLCEFLDLYEDLQGMSLGEFIDCYFAADDGGAEAPTEAADEVEAGKNVVGEPANNGDAEPAVVRPASMVGLRVVYRFPGRNVLADKAGVIRDSGGTVSFTDVDGEPWSNVARDKVHPISPENYREIHIIPREAKEFNAWLSGGKPVKGKPEGDLLRSLFVEFTGHPDKIAFAIMNAKKPYVDRFVMLPNNGFEDDQKPTTRLFGEHCFRVRKKDYIVKVVTP
jgi:hypothetical protein